MIHLTDRQAELLAFLRGHVAEHGYPPTVRAIGAAMGISSSNGVVCHLRAIERKGYIAREFGKDRAIRVLDGPADGDATPAPGSVPAPPQIHVYASVERGEVAATIRRPSVMPTAVCGFVVGSEALSHVGIRCGDWVFVEKPAGASAAVRARKLVAVRLWDKTVLCFAQLAGDLVQLTTRAPGSDGAFLRFGDFDAAFRGVAVGLWRGGVAPGAASERAA